MRAVVPSRAERALLAAPASAALLLVERTGCRHGQPVEYRQTLVRGDRYAVTAEFDARGYALSTTTPDPATTTRRRP